MSHPQEQDGAVDAATGIWAAGADDEDRVARAGLSAVLDSADRRVVEALREVSPGGLWGWLVGRHDWPGRSAPPDLQVHRRAASTVRPDDDLDAVAAAAGRFVVPGDAEWPAAHLDALQAPCLGLWVVGAVDLDVAVERAVAVVGSRTATAYGLRVAEGLGADLAERDWTVVSGAAYGIDGAAHRGALAGRGVSIAVLACGPDVDYPRGHAGLLERLRGEGLVVSEVPPGSHPTRARFLHRNRVIAALSAGTVMVEAGLRSGARSTVARAEELGRAVLVVPGPVTSALSAGCHRVLREVPEARVVTSAADVLEEVGRLGADLAPRPSGPASWRDGLPGPALSVLEALPTRGAARLDRLTVRTGQSLPDVRAAIGLLEAHGLVGRVAAGWRLTALALAGTRAESAARAEEEGRRPGPGGGQGALFPPLEQPSP